MRDPVFVSDVSIRLCVCLSCISKQYIKKHIRTVWFQMNTSNSVEKPQCLAAPITFDPMKARQEDFSLFRELVFPNLMLPAATDL